MSDIALSVENLSKLYRIGAKEKRHDTMSGALAAWCKSPWTNYRRLHAQTRFDHSHGLPSPVPGRRSPVAESSDLLWALKDVSFEIKAGEVVGIIGRNGAGKSTLLKVLSRITEPTNGRAIISGRVASLLEVGTGFHAELTGRENIYLNGTILGMTKKEVEKRFDDIVEFAEVGRFIDTPVKHYSSGMYVRLAFAVAAHLQPEILLVDEVLAVGDAAFQKKCLGKMKDVATEGRTVLFVSHQMAAVRSLCSRVIEVREGSVVRDGTPDVVIGQYLAGGGQQIVSERTWRKTDARPGNEQVRLLAVRILNMRGKPQAAYRTSEPIMVEMEIELDHLHDALFIGFDLMYQNRVILFRSCHNHCEPDQWPRLHLGYNKLRCTIPPNMLNNGLYYVAPRIALQSINWIIFNEAEVAFEVHMDHCSSPFWNPSHTVSFPGLMALFLPWRLEAATSAEDLPRVDHA